MPCPPYTIASAAGQHCIHTQCLLNWAAGGTQTGSEAQGSIEGELRVGGMEGTRGGGREGGLIMERARKGRNEAWTERGK